MMENTVTLIIRGTFAREAKWWRLGDEEDQARFAFADRLEHELSRRGLPGTVWKPALVEGFDYSSFSWSGGNRHRDRLAGARSLRLSLNKLAQRVTATPTEPLTVNFVAHSHGGNVVLEALRHLRPNVRVGRIALLGTPLITVRPALRLARFAFAAVLLGLFVLALMILLYVFIALGLFIRALFAADFFEAWSTSLLRETLLSPWGWVLPISLLYPLLFAWIFWAFGTASDVAWRTLCLLLEPLARLRGKSRWLVYGPSPRKLAACLGGRPILLFTSHNDEADLLLQVGSTPKRLYLEYVATRSSRLGRLFEIIFLRPFMLGALLTFIEMLLEVFCLGFSVWRTLVQDFEVASFAERPCYPPNLLVQQRLNIRPKASVAAALVGDDAGHHSVESGAILPRSLYLSIGEVINELRRQIQLRHSAYYDNDTVITQVADFLTGADVRGAETTPPPSLSPSTEFWTVLLYANIGVTALAVWIADPASESIVTATFPTSLPPVNFSMWIFFTLYVSPFYVLGIGLIFYLAVRRRMPVGLWRWFWVLWAISALHVLGYFAAARLGLVSALSTLPL